MKGSEKQIKWAMDIITESEKKINDTVNEDSTDAAKKVAEYKIYALKSITENMDADEIISKKGTIKNIANDYDLESGIKKGMIRAATRNKDVDKCIMESLTYVERINAIKEMKVRPY